MAARASILADLMYNSEGFGWALEWDNSLKGEGCDLLAELRGGYISTSGIDERLGACGGEFDEVLELGWDFVQCRESLT